MKLLKIACLSLLGMFVICMIWGTGGLFDKLYSAGLLLGFFIVPAAIILGLMLFIGFILIKIDNFIHPENQ